MNPRRLQSETSFSISMGVAARWSCRFMSQRFEEDLTNGGDPQGVTPQLHSEMMREAVELCGRVEVVGETKLHHPPPAAAATQVAHERSAFLQPVTRPEPDRLVHLRPQARNHLRLVVHQ